MFDPDIKIIIRPRQSMTWETFVATTPPGSIALDGAVRGGPRRDDVTLHVNRDHHEGVERDATMSTCRQVQFSIKGRFAERRGGKFQIHINDPDQDTALACWLLLNWKRFTGIQSHPHINRLIELTDRLDITGGAFPMALDDRLVRQHAWVFKPYADARKSGALAQANESVMRAILEAVFRNLDAFWMNQAGEAELDTRHEILHRSARFGFEIVDEIGGNDARCYLFSQGNLWNGYVSIVARKADGTTVYTVGRPSMDVDFSLPRLYKALNAAEKLDRARNWNGSPMIGGSSREGSTLTWQEVGEVIERDLTAQAEERCQAKTSQPMPAGMATLNA